MYGSGDGYGDNDGMRTLAQENERREAAGKPALSASESVKFLKSINPNAPPVSSVAQAPILGGAEGAAPIESTGAPVEYDTLGATQDLNKSQEMQTLREENARRSAQGLPDFSAPESVQFLNAVNPETFNPLNAEIDKQDQQIVNNFIAQQEAQKAQDQAAQQAAYEVKGGDTPNLQQALAPTGTLPNEGGAAPDGSLVGSRQAPDGQNIGMFQGQPDAPINQAQLDALSGQMVESGAPFISGGLTDESGKTIAGPAGRPEGMKPFLDELGKVKYADPQTAASMNRIEAQRMQEQKAAQQRAIQSIASRGVIPQEAQQGSPQANFIERMKTAEENPLSEQEIAQGQAMAQSMGTTFNPETGYSRDAFLQDRAKPKASSGQAIESDFDRASRERQSRIGQREAGSQTDIDTRRAQDKTKRSSSLDGLTDNQRSRIYGSGSKEAEMSKAGINPQTGVTYAQEREDQERQNAYDDAKIASLGQSDPDKLEQAKAQTLELMRTMDFGGDKALQDLTYRQTLIFLLGKMDQFDSEALLNPMPTPPIPSDSTET
tara:strand:- start:384 stop:2027 length:1644 start_codon:yes stop_codon:yes gene_type:complete